MYGRYFMDGAKTEEEYSFQCFQSLALFMSFDRRKLSFQHEGRKAGGGGGGEGYLLNTSKVLKEYIK